MSSRRNLRRNPTRLARLHATRNNSHLNAVDKAIRAIIEGFMDIAKQKCETGTSMVLDFSLRSEVNQFLDSIKQQLLACVQNLVEDFNIMLDRQMWVHYADLDMHRLVSTAINGIKPHIREQTQNLYSYVLSEGCMLTRSDFYSAFLLPIHYLTESVIEAILHKFPSRRHDYGNSDFSFTIGASFHTAMENILLGLN